MKSRKLGSAGIVYTKEQNSSVACDESQNSEVKNEQREENKPCQIKSERDYHSKPPKETIDSQANGCVNERRLHSQNALSVGSIEGTHHSNQENILLPSSITGENRKQERTSAFQRITKRPSTLCSATPDTQTTSSAKTFENMKTREKSTLINTSRTESQTKNVNSTCGICKGAIKWNSQLMKSLVEERKIPHKSSKYSHPRDVTSTRCRVCGHHLQDTSINQHLAKHNTAKELYYCLNCQNGINGIAIEPFPEPQYKQNVLARNSQFFRLLETKKLELRHVSTPNPSIEPRCGSCRRIFDYIGPLLFNLLDSNLNIYKAENGSAFVEAYYFCCLCEKGEDSLQSMQCHVLKHVRQGDVLCRMCKIKFCG